MEKMGLKKREEDKEDGTEKSEEEKQPRRVKCQMRKNGMKG